MTQLGASFVWTSQDTGDSDSEDDELEVMKAQDEDSEVRLPNGEAVLDNSVVGHPGCDRIYKVLKFSGHKWVRIKDLLKKYISECTICQKIK